MAMENNRDQDVVDMDVVTKVDSKRVGGKCEQNASQGKTKTPGEHFAAF